MRGALGRASFAAATYPLPPRNGGGASGHGGILWKPAGGGDARTWADVMGFVNATECPFPIYVDDPTPGNLLIPLGTYDLHECWFERPRLPFQDVVTMQTGAVLRNLRRIVGSVVLQGNPTTAQCLVFDPPAPGFPSVIFAELSAQYQNMGTRPMIDCPPVGGGPAIVFVSIDDGGYKLGNPATSFIGITAPGAACICGVRDQATNIDPTFISGPVGSILAYQQAGGGVTFAQLGTLPLFGGTLLNAPVTTLGGSGPTSFRPTTVFGTPLIGTMYFDTDLAPPNGKPIWFVGNPPSATGWVDATGAPA